MPKIYDMIADGLFDPSQIITHTMPLADAAKAYDIFDKKKKEHQSCLETLAKIKEQ